MGRPEECWARIGDRYLIADKLAEEVFARARLDVKNPDLVRRLRDVSAEELSGLVMSHPLRGAEGAGGEWDYDVPMLPGDHVTDDAGTGFVHTAPSHGDDDYQIGQKHGLPMTYNVMEDGSFRADLPLFGGKAILTPQGKEGDANIAVIEALIAAGKLLARGRLKHSYPHSWRSKAPLIYRNTPQWFAAIDKPVGDGQDTYGRTIRERALTSIDQLVTWTPKTGRNRLFSMIEARPDWVLSRQRAWGVPLTCFVRKGAKPGDADFLLRDPKVNARILDAFEAEGADAWYKAGAKERFLGNDHNPEDYEQVFDILDVWFDSGSTHAFVLRDRPDGSADGIADLYLEGTDQHRGWFHSSMLQACGTIGRAPYRGVLTHGFTLDAKGNKMSKSLGNTVAPEAVVKSHGADILRLWVAQSDYTVDLRIGDEILKGVSDSYRRLRNTLRFMLGNLSGFSEAERVAPADMPELERWILHRLAELDHKVRTGYATYDFPSVFRALFDFCTVDLSAVYFDIRKDALYCDGPTLRRNAARTVLDLLFHRLTTWLAPDPRLHDGGGLARALPRGEQLRPPRRHARDARRLARRTARREVGRHPPRPPRGDGGARSPAAGQGDRGEPRGRAGRPRVGPGGAQGPEIGGFRGHLHHLRPRPHRRPDPAGGIPSARGRRRRRGLRSRRGREVPPLLEDPPRRGHASSPGRLRPLRRGAGLATVRP